MELKVASPGRIWSTDPRVPAGPLLKYAAVEDALAQMAAKTRTGKVMKALQQLDNELENTNDSMNPGSNPDRSALVNRYRDNETLDRNIQKEAELTEELLKEAQQALVGRLVKLAQPPAALLEGIAPLVEELAGGAGAASKGGFLSRLFGLGRAAEPAAAGGGGLRNWLARRLGGGAVAARSGASTGLAREVQLARDAQIARAGAMAPESKLVQEVAARNTPLLPPHAPAQGIPGPGVFIPRRGAPGSFSDIPMPAEAPVAQAAAQETAAANSASLPPPPGMAPAQEGAAAGEAASGKKGPPPKLGLGEAYRDVFRPGGFGRMIKAPGNRFGLGVGALMTLPSLVRGDISLPQAAFNVLAPLPAFRAGGGIGMATSLLTPTVSEHIFGGAPAAPPPMPMQAPSPPINVSVAAPAAPAMPQAPVFQPGFGAYG